MGMMRWEGWETWRGWKKRAGWNPRQAQKGPTIRSKVGCHPFASQYAVVVPIPGGIRAIP